MKGKGIALYFAPSIVLLASWGGVLFVREFSLLTFDGVSVEASLYLLLYFTSFFLGTILGPLMFRFVTVTERPVYAYRSTNVRANWLILLSIVSIALLIYKFLMLMGGEVFSLANITDLRLSRGRDSSEVKGGTISGVLGMALSGFFIISYVYKVYFYRELKPSQRRLLNVVFVLGLFTSFLSGGRFVAAIALVVVYVTYRLCGSANSFERRPFDRSSKKLFKVFKAKSSFLSTIAKVIFIFSIIYIFSMIFINRAIGGGGDFIALLGVISNNLSGVSMTHEHKAFLLEVPELIPLYFVVALFQYYIGHAMYQFDILFGASYPLNAPYFLAYQCYLQTLLLNKMGLDLITIQQILDEIVNPGVYFTLAGAFYLDFGYWGGCVAIFFISIIGSYYWVRYLRKMHFFDLYICILYFVLILFSPVVAITSSGVYPSLLTLALFLKIFVPSRRRIN
ncbi:MAG: hypothetical protein KUG64_11220 [Cycloclasticus sp.]|nr:hypothetical protein [Cycloclasticus sp.]